MSESSVINFMKALREEMIDKKIIELLSDNNRSNEDILKILLEQMAEKNE